MDEPDTIESQATAWVWWKNYYANGLGDQGVPMDDAWLTKVVPPKTLLVNLATSTFHMCLESVRWAAVSVAVSVEHSAQPGGPPSVFSLDTQDLRWLHVQASSLGNWLAIPVVGICPAAVQRDYPALVNGALYFQQAGEPLPLWRYAFQRKQTLTIPELERLARQILQVSSRDLMAADNRPALISLICTALCAADPLEQRQYYVERALEKDVSPEVDLEKNW